MPAKPPPPRGYPPIGKAPNMGHGDGGTTVGATGDSVRTAEALHGWHDLNMAVARSLPTSLLRAGQLHRATLLALRRRARVR